MKNGKALTKDEFLKLMHFPHEWAKWDMYPDELCRIQIGGYKRGHEKASEHTRNGAFHWWLRTHPSLKSEHLAPTKAQLKRLTKLTYLDPDPLMGADVRRYIAKATNCDSEVADLLSDPS